MIGNQQWTTKNLSVTWFRNGEKIKQSKSKEDWLKSGYREEPTWCYYNFDESYAYLGKLYNYYALSSNQNIAPEGWKVPSFLDYYKLFKYLDPLLNLNIFVNEGSLSGGSLKIKNEKNYWQGKNCPQLDSGFNAIPSGGYSPSLNYPEYDWDKVGEVTRFWCLTDWEEIIPLLFKEEEMKKLIEELNNGEFDDAAITIRLSGNCIVDADDDPKIHGYSVRLIKEWKWKN